jgi:5-methylcytosine-specific restriction endonuclease McrA
MDYYLVYHNREKMGYEVEADPSGYSSYRIRTKKSVKSLIGATIWLVEGHGYTPRKYHLRVMFIVDETKIGKNKINYAIGKIGKAYGNKFLINSNEYQEWFRPFQKRMANFSLGLQKLQHQDVEFFQTLVGGKKQKARPSSVGLIFPDRNNKNTSTNLNSLTTASEGKAYFAEQQRRRRSSALTQQRLVKDNYCCQHCGIKPDLAPLGADANVAEVHHIYPLKDSNDALNTQIDDLITLCPTCHRIAHTVGRIHKLKTLDLKMLRKFYPRLIKKTTIRDGYLNK